MRLGFLVSLLMILSVAAPASAVDGNDFNPGYIISDRVFYDSTSMSRQDVQRFIQTKGASCKPGPDGTPCLKDYTENTPSTPARNGCTAHAGKTGEASWTIISDVAIECAINPQVLLVLLQKEQGLITASGATLNPLRYERATGLSCPDGPSGPICDPAHGGFYKQVRGAAERFNMYRDGAKYQNYRPGVISSILYHPNRQCGTSQVYIENFATAALYTYTPFQPNLAALQNMNGSGDACSSYGNRNFYRTFTTWFGDPTRGEAPPSEKTCTANGTCDFYLANSWTARNADVAFSLFGTSAGTPLVGDWSGRGFDSVGIRSGAFMSLADNHFSGPGTYRYNYGRPGDEVFVGDWNGDGRDTPAVRRGNRWYLTNSLNQTQAEVEFSFGRAGDQVLIGDWNGDGRDTFAVRRGNRIYITNTTAGGNAEHEFAYGRISDAIVVGDWDGDGNDTFGVRRGNAYYLKNSMTGGNADILQRYGRATDQTIVGDWNGDGIDTLGVYRP